MLVDRYKSCVNFRKLNKKILIVVVAESQWDCFRYLAWYYIILHLLVIMHIMFCLFYLVIYTSVSHSF